MNHYDIETIMRHHTPDLGLLRDNSRIAERRDQGHDTKIIPDSKKAEYLATYTRAGGRNKEQCWTLAQRLLSEVDLDCSDEWHEYWGENAPLLEDSADLAEAEQLKLIGFAVSRCVLQPSGLPPACGTVGDSCRSVPESGWHRCAGIQSETFALKAACNPLADD